jgi:adsorption protein B
VHANRALAAVTLQATLATVAAELALFAALGFLLFSLDDLAVDALHFARKAWRALFVYRRHARSDARSLTHAIEPGWMVVLIPAWDESAVIAKMLRATLERFDHSDFTLLVGYYRNDPATAFAIGQVDDPRVIAVEVPAEGPTTKADCLNHLYAFLVRHEARSGRRARALVLHDAEDLVHPLELKLFDRLIGRAGVIQLPVVPLPDPNSPWIGGHYCDEFAESHGKELVVREAVGASIPLAGVGCAISRDAIARLAAAHDGCPFAGGSMTEDYEMGLRLGALGEKTVFVRLPPSQGEAGVVASRGHFPATLGAAVRQKARWLGGIAFAGWDRLGWSGGLGERWFRLRDRRGPLAALLLLAGYVAALLWAQLWLAAQLGAPLPPQPSDLLATLLEVNFVLLLWRTLMRIGFTAHVYGIGEGLASVPRILAGNLIAILAASRALFQHAGGGPKQWDKTAHVFPAAVAGR